MYPHDKYRFDFRVSYRANVRSALHSNFIDGDATVTSPTGDDAFNIIWEIDHIVVNSVNSM
jgi:hypothetical protein